MAFLQVVSDVHLEAFENDEDAESIIHQLIKPSAPNLALVVRLHVFFYRFGMLCVFTMQCA